MSNPFAVGAKIVVTTAHGDVTAGRVYTVHEVYPNSVTIIDDVADVHQIATRHCAYAVAHVPSYTGVAAVTQRRNVLANLHGQKLPPAISYDAVEGEELSYDERKAQQRVTSLGKFRAGQVLVYCDGTQALTRLTVQRCTATAVWFEETYSTSFDPNEFTLEY